MENDINTAKQSFQEFAAEASQGQSEMAANHRRSLEIYEQETELVQNSLVHIRELELKEIAVAMIELKVELVSNSDGRHEMRAELS